MVHNLFNICRIDFWALVSDSIRCLNNLVFSTIIMANWCQTIQCIYLLPFLKKRRYCRIWIDLGNKHEILNTHSTIIFHNESTFSWTYQGMGWKRATSTWWKKVWVKLPNQRQFWYSTHQKFWKGQVRFWRNSWAGLQLVFYFGEDTQYNKIRYFVSYSGVVRFWYLKGRPLSTLSACSINELEVVIYSTKKCRQGRTCIR